MISDAFDDVLPHVITVYSRTSTNKYGRNNNGPSRQYRCLLDGTVRVVSTLTQDEVTVGLTAYCAAIPIGGTTPVPILDTETLTIDSYGGVARPIISIASHWDGTDGALDNIEVMMS